MLEKTLAIIKPHAVKNHDSGAIIELIERNGFSILGMKKIHLTTHQAQEFYAVHKERPFFGELVEGMTQGPVIVMALQREDGIKSWRDLMGATDPKKAPLGSLRSMFGVSIGDNATHGSDAPETALVEVKFFFPELN